VDLFEPYDYVVAPSGSCAGMIARHYPEALAGDAQYASRARKLAAKTFELVSFLVRMCGVTQSTAKHSGAVCYHDSCSSLREMGVKDEPRKLLSAVEGLELKELAESDVCCGFGGLFCVKYPEISARMADDKIADARSTGAETLASADLGCLLHLAGRMERQGRTMHVRHIAEILADMSGAAALGES
jgi:L-lactate dehydrogenase complex protein LldE